jgi:ankyrin repeat protein
MKRHFVTHPKAGHAYGLEVFCDRCQLDVAVEAGNGTAAGDCDQPIARWPGRAGSLPGITQPKAAMNVFLLKPSHLSWAALLLAPAAALALDCPQMPRQAQQDWVSEVNIAVGKIGAVAGPELTARTQQATSDLLGKLPRADKVYLEQMMFASYCSTLRDNASLAEAERERRVQAYVRQLRQTLAAADAPAATATDPRDVARRALERVPVEYSAAEFLRTVKEGRPETVDLFLRAGMDPKTSDRDDNSAVEYAAVRGEPKIVEALLRAKATVSGRAVTFAAMYGHLAVLRLFLARGQETTVLEQAFLAAASDAQIETLRLLTPRIANPVSLASTALVDATWNGRLANDVNIDATVRELIALGADVNTQDANGWTALIRAASKGLARTVRTLLAAHARVETVCTCRGIMDGHYTALALTLAHGSDSSNDIASQLLEAGADPNTRTHDGHTPLMLVAQHNENDAMLTALLDRGADPNARDAMGSTALFHALVHEPRFDDPATVQTLIARGAQVNVRRDSDGLTPLHRAAANGLVQSMQRLLAAGADVRARDAQGRTPLIWAVSEGRSAALRLLLSRGGSAGDNDQDGKTALAYARDLKENDGRSTIISILTKAGAP